MTDDISGDIIEILEKNTGFSDHRKFKHWSQRTSIGLNMHKENWQHLKDFTGLPSGKQRQKKSGRGRPTPSLIASVITAEYKIPVQILKISIY
jgi:hypothetical protein